MQLIKFLTNSKNVEKSGYIWNTIGSSLIAFQAIILLAFITRFGSLNDAGIFTIAFVYANFFLNIGKYGMRNYQVSDTTFQFNFSSYRKSRYITTALMLVVSFLYILIVSQLNDYSLKKSIIIITVCIFKSIDSIEDVYHGLFQQNNRLDVAGKNLSIRMIVTILVFILTIVITQSPYISIIASTIITVVTFLFLNNYSYNSLKKEIVTESLSSVKNKSINLLSVCFPLFIGSFLSYYILNAPKYSIDSNIGDEAQAIFGFISMPIFVISLLISFIYNPVISKIASLWNEGNINIFKRMVKKQIYIIILITVFCEAVSMVAGISILSIVFHTDLSGYKLELLIIILDGGFLALSGLLGILLTIMRKQSLLAIIYAIVSVIAFILSPIFVKRYEITGASTVYLLLMIILCILSSVPILRGIHNRKKEL